MENNEIRINLNKKQQNKFAKLLLKNIAHHYGINSNLPEDKKLTSSTEIGIMMEIEKITGLNNKRFLSFEEIFDEITK